MLEIEHRRHSWRLPDGTHLTQAGVELARRVGETMGSFDLVVSSHIPRAFETAIAMGYAVDRQEELLGDDGGIAGELDWTLGCAEFARACAVSDRVARVCGAQAELLRSIARDLPRDGRALLVSHGGIIEQGVVGLLPGFQFEPWGRAFARCEGVLLQFEGTECVGAQQLRLPDGWQ
ncbi:MAG: histidine phosphatase family protein [Dehalococcoidia bacterium]